VSEFGSELFFCCIAKEAARNGGAAASDLGDERRK
jgi:hypothetical protein